MLLFASLREQVGTGRLELELPPGSDAGAAFDALATVTPGLAGIKSKVRCALGDAYAAWDTVLTDGCELAFIPPTAGG